MSKAASYDTHHWAAGVRIVFRDGDAERHGVVEAVDATTGESRIRLEDGTELRGSDIINIPDWGDY